MMEGLISKIDKIKHLVPDTSIVGAYLRVVLILQVPQLVRVVRGPTETAPDLTIPIGLLAFARACQLLLLLLVVVTVELPFGGGCAAAGVAVAA